MIDFLYFREGRKATNSDHAFSLLEELEHTQFQTVAKQQCDKNRPGDCESFSKFEAYSFSFSKAGESFHLWLEIRYYICPHSSRSLATTPYRLN